MFNLFYQNKYRWHNLNFVVFSGTVRYTSHQTSLGLLAHVLHFLVLECGHILWPTCIKTWPLHKNRSLFRLFTTCLMPSPCMTHSGRSLYRVFLHTKIQFSYKRQCFTFTRQKGDCVVHFLHIISIFIHIFSSNNAFYILFHVNIVLCSTIF